MHNPGDNEAIGSVRDPNKPPKDPNKVRDPNKPPKDSNKVKAPNEATEGLQQKVDPKVVDDEEPIIKTEDPVEVKKEATVPENDTDKTVPNKIPRDPNKPPKDPNKVRDPNKPPKQRDPQIQTQQIPPKDEEVKLEAKKPETQPTDQQPFQQEATKQIDPSKAPQDTNKPSKNPNNVTDPNQVKDPSKDLKENSQPENNLENHQPTYVRDPSKAPRDPSKPPRDPNKPPRDPNKPSKDSINESPELQQEQENKKQQSEINQDPRKQEEVNPVAQKEAEVAEYVRDPNKPPRDPNKPPRDPNKPPKDPTKPRDPNEPPRNVQASQEVEKPPQTDVGDAKNPALQDPRTPNPKDPSMQDLQKKEQNGLQSDVRKDPHDTPVRAKDPNVVRDLNKPPMGISFAKGEKQTPFKQQDEDDDDIRWGHHDEPSDLQQDERTRSPPLIKVSRRQGDVSQQAEDGVGQRQVRRQNSKVQESPARPPEPQLTEKEQLKQLIVKYQLQYEKSENEIEKKLLDGTLQQLRAKVKTLEYAEKQSPKRVPDAPKPQLNPREQIRANLLEIYQFYAKQTFMNGKSVTFDKLLHVQNVLTMVKFMYFCRDFEIINLCFEYQQICDILTKQGIEVTPVTQPKETKKPSKFIVPRKCVTDKQTLVEFFKKCSANNTELTFIEFELSISKIATFLYQHHLDQLTTKQDKPTALILFLLYLQIQKPSEYRKKMSFVGVPFAMKDRAPEKITYDRIRTVKPKSSKPLNAQQQSPQREEEPPVEQSAPVPPTKRAKDPVTWDNLHRTKVEDIGNDFDPKDLLQDMDLSDQEDQIYLQEYNLNRSKEPIRVEKQQTSSVEPVPKQPVAVATYAYKGDYARNSSAHRNPQRISQETQARAQQVDAQQQKREQDIYQSLLKNQNQRAQRVSKRNG